MEKGRSLLRWTGVLVTVTIVLIFGIRVQGDDKLSKESDETRADIITIDSMKVFGELERPEVVFLHDRHADALKKKNKDCTTCHLSENDRLSPKFRRLKDTDKIEVMEIYHANCIECHREITASKEKSGPVECGECHRENYKLISSRQPMGLDKSLHYRHSKANNNKCERCHHEYDEKEKKLFYAKGKEGTCRYCHKGVKEENRISMHQASHFSCIDCHRKTLLKNKVAGPVNCSGCHDLDKQQAIEKVKTVPRMERKQPDILFVKTGKQEDKKEYSDTRMNPVPFNHKAHEGYNDSCRVCHHANLKTCSECHTETGSKEGKQIKLEQAMHQLETKTSCLGCHEINKQDKSCIGCHSFIEKGGKQDASSCLNCHMTPLPKSTDVAFQPDEKMRAAMLLESRKAITETYNDEDIPEKVVIKKLVDKYEPVELPHRKIVHALVKNIKDNKLANYFHSKKETVCQGCHHNSPAAKKPPLCGSCHGKPFDEKNLFKPGILGAYHRQCIGCHKEMGIEKPVGCTECHKERKRYFD